MRTEHAAVTYLVFALTVCLLASVATIAARRTLARDFYSAVGSRSSFRSGWAMAVDSHFTVSFVGLVGLVSLYGYDGFMYAVAWVVGYVLTLLLIAEPCRKMGEYTVEGIVFRRNDAKAVKGPLALSTTITSTIYLTALMIGSGSMGTVIGLDANIAMAVAAFLMMFGVLFGMPAPMARVRIATVLLLVAAALFGVAFVQDHYGRGLSAYLSVVGGDAKVQASVAWRVGLASGGMSDVQLGQRFFEPGLYFKNPIDQISMGMALLFGSAGLPQISMRLFAMPSHREATRSVVWAVATVSALCVLTLFLGTGAALHVGAAAIAQIDPGGNQAVPLLAQHFGGGRQSLAGQLMLAFVAAVAFTVIVGMGVRVIVSAGHQMSDFIYQALSKGEKPPDQFTSVLVCRLLIVAAGFTLGILAKGHNMAHLLGLAFAVAASANLPVILLTLYWKGCNTAGVRAGLFWGATTAVVLVLTSPNMTWLKVPLFPLLNPSLVSVPVGFLAVLIFSRLNRDQRAEENWPETYVCSRIGVEPKTLPW